MLHYIRTPLVFIIFLLLCFAGLIVQLLFPFNANVHSKVMNTIGGICLKLLGIKLEIAGIQNFKKHIPSIIYSNHQSGLDVFLIGKAAPPRSVTIGKKSIIYIPFFGLLYWVGGHILIDRGNRRKAIKAMEDTINQMRKKNVNVWVMPEGTRSYSGDLLPFKKGAFFTSIKGQFPLVPVAISSYKDGVDLNRFRGNIIKINVLPPITPQGYDLKSVEKLTDHCYQTLKSELIALNKDHQSFGDKNVSLRSKTKKPVH